MSPYLQRVNDSMISFSGHHPQTLLLQGVMRSNYYDFHNNDWQRENLEGEGWLARRKKEREEEEEEDYTIQGYGNTQGRYKEHGQGAMKGTCTS